MRWLISTDGTNRSQKAAKFAASFLQPQEDEVTLLGIINRTSKAALNQALDELEKLINGIVKKRILLEGSVVQTIEEIARQEPYDVALYASRGRRGLTKILLGSVAAKLVDEMPCSVLIVRNIPTRVERVLVATTLSRGHEAPIDEAAYFASISGAKLTILHVMSQITLADEYYSQQLELTSEEAISKQTREGRRLSELLAIAEKYDIPIETKIRHGLVEDEIIQELIEGGYDLMVLGAHSIYPRPTWEGFLIEDVSKTILLHTDCPVLIVRR